MAPPTRAATTLTPVEIALWSENSSPRCSAWLCSAMNGDWTTKKAWFAAPMSAEQRTTAGEEPRWEGHDGSSSRAGGHHEPDERGVEVERRKVQVEVDPPEAQGDAVHQRDEEEDPGVALEAAKAPRVPPQRPGHAPPERSSRSPPRYSCQAPRWSSRSLSPRPASAQPACPRTTADRPSAVGSTSHVTCVVSDAGAPSQCQLYANRWPRTSSRSSPSTTLPSPKSSVYSACLL